MCQTELAELLDSYVASKVALLREGDDGIVVSNLRVNEATNLLSLCVRLGWADIAFDTSGNEWKLEQLSEDFAPFRVNIRKPSSSDNVILFLTNSGFKDWLEGSPLFPAHCKVLRLTKSFRTWSLYFSPWTNEDVFEESLTRKSPLLLVKEHSSKRSVPSDIRPWVLCEGESIPENDAAASIWADAATREILKGLSEEVEEGRLKFKGPPRLELELPSNIEGIFAKLGHGPFSALQDVARWVFEDSASAEARHIIFTKEFARAGHPDVPLDYIKRNIATAFDSSQIVYEVSVSDLGRDTIKILSDLRKSVTEENAKISDITRQMIGSLSGSLGVGIALVAARIAASAPPIVLIFGLCVIWVYMIMVMYSGSQFIKSFDKTRSDWHSLLYKFLPDKEYKAIVVEPIAVVSRIYYVVRNLSIVSLFLLSVAVFFSAQYSPSNQSTDTRSEMGSTTEDGGQTIVEPSTPRRQDSRADEADANEVDPEPLDELGIGNPPLPPPPKIP